MPGQTDQKYIINLQKTLDVYQYAKNRVHRSRYCIIIILRILRMSGNAHQI